MVKKLVFILAIIGSLLATGVLSAWADEASFLYNRGNKLYREENFEEAIEAYAQASIKIRNPALYYNLGNAYYRTGDIGRAGLNYERALKLDPRNPDIKQNLAYLKLQMADKVVPVEQSFLEKTMSFAVSFLSLNEWVTVCLVFYLFGMGALFILIIHPGNRTALAAAVLAAVLLIAAFPFAGSRYYHDRVEVRAVALASSVDARSAPQEEEDVVFSFHAGISMKVRDTRMGWHQVVLPNGLSGWVKADDIGII